jgi:hypothetical protein
MLQETARGQFIDTHRFSFRGWLSATRMDSQTSIAAAQQQTIDMRRDFELLTEWTESTAGEKTAQKRDGRPCDSAPKVNSSAPKTLLL